MRPTKLDRSHAPSGLAQNLLTCFTDSALRGLVDVIEMQRKLTSQLLISVNQQQRAKSAELESWMWQRNETLQRLPTHLQGRVEEPPPQRIRRYS